MFSAVISLAKTSSLKSNDRFYSYILFAVLCLPSTCSSSSSPLAHRLTFLPLDFFSAFVKNVKLVEKCLNAGNKNEKGGQTFKNLAAVHKSLYEISTLFCINIKYCLGHFIFFSFCV